MDSTAEGLPTARNEVREAWTSWLNEQEWKTFVTATFRDESGMAPTYSRVTRAARFIERSLTRSLERPSFFGVLEKGSWSQRMHLHFLLSCDARLANAIFAKHRKFEGFTKVIELQDSVDGVSEYVTKYVTKDRDPFWIAGGIWNSGRSWTRNTDG